MKRRLFQIFILLHFFIYFLACSGDSKSELQNQETDTSKILTEIEETNSDEIELNNGKKWKVDEAMMIYIRRIETEIFSFTTEKSAAMMPYTAMAESISVNLDSLTSNCTMSGKAHDELHQWLLPFLDMSDAFSVAEITTDAEEIYQEMRESFVEFNRCFE